MIRSLSFALPVVALALAGCGGTVVPPSSAGTRSAGQRPAPNAYRGATLPTGSAATAGAIVGADARSLTQMFGAARLDMTEGLARKMQFTGNRCVLDAYLYPPRQGAEAVVTHVDARTPQGVDMDRDQCIATLRR
jgi:hypothetical protein